MAPVRTRCNLLTSSSLWVTWLFIHQKGGNEWTEWNSTSFQEAVIHMPHTPVYLSHPTIYQSLKIYPLYFHVCKSEKGVFRRQVTDPEWRREGLWDSGLGDHGWRSGKAQCSDLRRQWASHQETAGTTRHWCNQQNCWARQILTEFN